MFVVLRFRVEAGEQEAFVQRLTRAVEVLAAQHGFVGARAGRNTDDPRLLALTMEWRDVGSFRRALSPYEVKVAAVPLLSQALDEPTVYESIDFQADVWIDVSAAVPGDIDIDAAGAAAGG